VFFVFVLSLDEETLSVACPVRAMKLHWMTTIGHCWPSK
jgi:hypothetical protein